MIRIARHLAAALLLGTVPAQAATVSLTYTLTIDQIDESPGGRFASLGVFVGSILQGTITYDSTAGNTDSDPDSDRWPVQSVTSNVDGAEEFERASIFAQVNSLDPNRWLFQAWNERADGYVDLLTLGFIGNFGYGGSVGLGTGRPVIGPPLFNTPGIGQLSYYLDDGTDNGIGGAANGTFLLSLGLGVGSGGGSGLGTGGSGAGTGSSGGSGLGDASAGSGQGGGGGTTVIPLPSSILSLGLGLLALAAFRRRRPVAA